MHKSYISILAEIAENLQEQVATFLGEIRNS